MLQKLVFQDNIYQLARTIDTISEGLVLELAPEYFFDKTVDDSLFLDMAIQKIYSQIQVNSQIAGYISILHSLYSCQKKYLQLIDAIMHGNCAMKENFIQLVPKLSEIYKGQIVLQTKISASIQKNDRNTDSHDVVSRNELSELLNF